MLDDGGTGIGLDGNGGCVTLDPGTGGVAVVLNAAGVPLASQGFNAAGLTIVPSLNFAAYVGMPLTVVENTATPAAGNPITGAFTNLAQDGTLAVSYGSAAYVLAADYAGGDGNDLVLTPQPTAATPSVVAIAVGGSYTGLPFAATATVTPLGGAAGSSLEGISPTLTYYAGSTATGAPLPGADGGWDLYRCGCVPRQRRLPARPESCRHVRHHARRVDCDGPERHEGGGRSPTRRLPTLSPASSIRRPRAC